MGMFPDGLQNSPVIIDRLSTKIFIEKQDYRRKIPPVNREKQIHGHREFRQKITPVNREKNYYFFISIPGGNYSAENIYFLINNLAGFNSIENPTGIYRKL